VRVRIVNLLSHVYLEALDMAIISILLKIEEKNIGKRVVIRFLM
jgi:hypothetical protein